MCEITEDESLTRRLDSLAEENEVLRATVERLRRDRDRLVDRMIDDQGEGAGLFRFVFRSPEYRGMSGWWSCETREEAERLFREKWDMDVAPLGENGGAS